MARYAITDLRTGETDTDMSMADVALMTGLSPNEIAWAIEEEGECETDEYRVTEQDDA
jgi:hypothetical protein